MSGTDVPAPRAYTCPTCGAAVPAGGPWRPFCGERCKMVDLGAWLLGHYRVPSVSDPDGEPEGAPPPHDPSDPRRPPDDDDPAA